MKVHIPTPLRSYTGKKGVVEAGGATVGELLAEIDRHYPGFRFRIIDEQDSIRRHIKIFINEKPAPNLSAPTKPGDTIHIICALSGGL
jgi:molybdopterin converting factor small subunit